MIKTHFTKSYRDHIKKEDWYRKVVQALPEIKLPLMPGRTKAQKHFAFAERASEFC